MAVQRVFEMTFQGDTWIINRWHPTYYAYGQIRPNGEEVWSGTSSSMVDALRVMHQEMSGVASDIDQGIVQPMGPFLDERGEEIPL